MKDLIKAIMGILFASFLIAFPTGSNPIRIFFALIILVISLFFFLMLIDLIWKKIHQHETLKREGEIEVARQERKAEIEGEIEQFRNSNKYHYIEKFATKYFPDNYSENDFTNLARLLEAKGFPLKPETLNEILKRAREKIRYKKFEKKLLQLQSQDKQKIIRYFLETYGENYKRYINYLERYFFQEHIALTKSVEEYVQQTKKEIELEYFEQTLLKSTHKQDYEIDNMDGYEFEKFLVSLFTDMGHKVDHTPASRDQGADLILLKHGEKIAVQAKRCNAPITNKAVQEVVGSINFYKADIGMVVTNSTFTASACELAKANNVKLIDGKDLKRLIEQF
jgi:restriction system protein